MHEQNVTFGRLALLVRGPAWLGRDARIVVLARALRTFGYGCTSILLAGMLSEDGVSAAGIGLLLGVAALGSVTASIAMGVFADRFGRRRSLLLTAVPDGLGGGGLRPVRVLPDAARCGLHRNDLAVDQRQLPLQRGRAGDPGADLPDRHHTAAFTRYNMSALLAGALGGLAAAALGMLTTVEPGDAAFVLYAVLSVVILGLFRRLSPNAERTAADPDWPARRQSTHESNRPSPLMCKLACLFAVDAFAGGLVVQAVLALWFQQRFAATDAELGFLFFGANLLPAMSQAVAPGLVARYGLPVHDADPARGVESAAALCAAVAVTWLGGRCALDPPGPVEDRRPCPAGVHGRDRHTGRTHSGRESDDCRTQYRGVGESV